MVNAQTGHPRRRERQAQTPWRLHTQKEFRQALCTTEKGREPPSPGDRSWEHKCFAPHGCSQRLNSTAAQCGKCASPIMHMWCLAITAQASRQDLPPRPAHPCLHIGMRHRHPGSTCIPGLHTHACTWACDAGRTQARACTQARTTLVPMHRHTHTCGACTL
eukprot:1159165-Pelagomonas_calceolata.AAC.2